MDSFHFVLPFEIDFACWLCEGKFSEFVGNGNQSKMVVLHNRRELLERLMLIKVGLAGNHVNDDMRMLFSSSGAEVKVSVRLTQVIVINII